MLLVPALDGGAVAEESNLAHADPSYADQASFGFCVDVGNGFTTLVPSVLFAVSITSPLLDARHLGMLGLVMFWQEFYGTCVYFFQYLAVCNLGG